MGDIIKPRRKRTFRGIPKPVAERWGRMIRLKWAHHLGRAYARWKIPRREKARKKALDQAFETIKHFTIKNEHTSFKGTKILFNIGLYLLIAHKDIQALKLDALTHPDEWTRKLNARIILLTIYEWDADEVSGRELHEALQIMEMPEELCREAIVILRRLRRIQEKSKKQFAFIRNVAIAHRDPDALIQYRAIRDLNVKAVWAIAAEFFSEVERFVGLLTKMMLAGNNLHSYIQQWSATHGGSRSDERRPDIPVR